MNKILPLGTIVTLKNGDNSKLMIISRGTLVNQYDKEVYFDYAGVLIPQGLTEPKETYFFNRENVAEVIFLGYVNIEEQQFERTYNSKIQESGYSKGVV